MEDKGRYYFDIEEWRDTYIYGERYEVSSHGRVRSKVFIKTSRNMYGEISYKAGGKLLAQYSSVDGYKRTELSLNKVRVPVMVHRLVARAFISGYAEGLVVNHKDSNRSNNHASNLEWVTTQENVIHSYEYGNATNSENSHPRAVLSSELVAKIAQYRSEGKTYKEISEATGIKYCTVWSACNGRNWKSSYTDAQQKLQ